MGEMANPGQNPVEAHGTIRHGGIVLDPPIDLPEGTEVRVSVQVVRHAPELLNTNSANADDAPVRPDLTNEQILQWARQHPAPKEWWDATDNPFEP